MALDPLEVLSPEAQARYAAIGAAAQALRSVRIMPGGIGPGKAVGETQAWEVTYVAEFILNGPASDEEHLSESIEELRAQLVAGNERREHDAADWNQDNPRPKWQTIGKRAPKVDDRPTQAMDEIPESERLPRPVRPIKDSPQA